MPMPSASSKNSLVLRLLQDNTRVGHDLNYLHLVCEGCFVRISCRCDAFFLGGSREKRAVNLLGPSVIRIASANHPTMALFKRSKHWTWFSSNSKLIRSFGISCHQHKSFVGPQLVLTVARSPPISPGILEASKELEDIIQAPAVTSMARPACQKWSAIFNGWKVYPPGN